MDWPRGLHIEAGWMSAVLHAVQCWLKRRPAAAVGQSRFSGSRWPSSAIGLDGLLLELGPWHRWHVLAASLPVAWLEVAFDGG